MPSVGPGWVLLVAPWDGDAPAAGTRWLHPSGAASSPLAQTPKKSPEERWGKAKNLLERGKFILFWGCCARQLVTSPPAQPCRGESLSHQRPNAAVPTRGPSPPPRSTAPVISTQKMLGFCLGKHGRYVH